MKPSTHRYVLPPVLLGIHAVFLLPLILSPSILRPPHFPGHSWPRYDPDPRHGGCGSRLIDRLYLPYSIPLGVIGILGVYVSKQLAGKIPLPKDERRQQLAQIIEWSVLFGMGVMEEVWRWGLVRLLVWLEGGHGGFRGTGCFRDPPEGRYWTHVVEFVGVSLEFPSFWEGLYLMGWTWSAIECLYSWYGVRPIISNTRTHPQNSPSPKRAQIQFRRNSEGPILSTHRPLLGKRTRSDSVVGSNEQGSKESRAILNTFSRKKRDIPAPRPRDAEDRTVQFIDNNTTAAESESSRTAYDESIRPTHGSLLYQPKHIDTDLETGLLSRLREIRREQAEEQADSDNGYGDDEESVSSDSGSARSSIDSARFESVTPLLSSSLPYDPSQQHPHHESQALLQNQRQQMSYNTMADPLPLAPADDNEDRIVTVHECDPEEGYSDHDREATPRIQKSPIDRVYPSYPPYSATYNHSHFSNIAAGPSSATAITRPSSTKRKSASNSIRSQQCSSRTVYGADVNTLSPYLPILWRAAALLRHISHALIYAWAPALVYKGHFQWMSFLILCFLAGKKGWSTVEWFGGGVSRTGLTKASVISLILAVFLYLASLGLWGIIMP